MTITSAVPDPAAVETLLQLSGGGVLPRCLHAVTNLGVADVLGDSPQPVAVLAAATGAQAEPLARALRLLAAHGVFSYEDGQIGHTPTSRLLRADHPQSMRQLVRMFGLPAFWTVIGEIEYSLRTGQPSADKVLPGGVWGYLGSAPDESRVFDDAMTAKAHGQVAAVVEAYDFAPFRTIADIGGGRGHLLRGILAQVPTANGVLFDQPHVVPHVTHGAPDRLTVQAGDFFRDDLPPADLFLLMEVIHDWDDQHATVILQRVRAAAQASSRVLLIEALIPENGNPAWAKTLDLWMLTISGKQRTLPEYRSLFAASGWASSRVIETAAGVAIIEGVPA